MKLSPRTRQEISDYVIYLVNSRTFDENCNFGYIPVVFSKMLYYACAEKFKETNKFRLTTKEILECERISVDNNAMFYQFCTTPEAEIVKIHDFFTIEYTIPKDGKS